MQPTPRVVEIYESVDGSRPFSEWMVGLKDLAVRARILARIDRLRIVLLGDCKSIGEGVHELRIDSGPEYRVYFAQDGRVLVILLTGGSKASQQKDIATAKAYWEDYRSRSNA